MTGHFWQNRRVLITGAGGFIASHLVERLSKAGAKVRGFVRYNSRGDSGMLSHLDRDVMGQVDLVAGDLRDFASVSQAARGMETIFHLGAIIAIPYSIAHPDEVVETNMGGTLNVLMAGRAAGVERVVHTSTSEVYGAGSGAAIDEDHPYLGRSPYAASRIGADKLAESFFYSYDLPVVIVRPFNTYGPRQSVRAVIPTIISQMLAGEVVKLGNPTTHRDYIYVSDVVEGFLKAAEVSGIEGNVYNLGLGKEALVVDLVDEIGRQLGRAAKIQVDDERLRPPKTDSLRLVSDSRKARQTLGWEPEVSLEQGLARTIEWIRAHESDYRLEKSIRY